ncbi:MAG: hypothetical protein WAX77_07585 [Methylococcaceae bacterium]
MNTFRHLFALAFLASALFIKVAVAADGLTNLKVPLLSPAFSPAITEYEVPATSVRLGVSIPVTATLSNPTDLLYINNTPIASGKTFNTWVGNGSASVVVYRNWVQVGRYTIKIDGGLTSLDIPQMSPAFSPVISSYTITASSIQLGQVTAVTAVLGKAGDLLYINNTPIVSGQTFNAWTGNGSISVVVYRNWKEVGHYTITVKP